MIFWIFNSISKVVDLSGQLIITICTITIATFTIIMAIAIVVTAIIAKDTLYYDKETRMMDLSAQMIKNWYEGRYSDKVIKISELKMQVVTKNKSFDEPERIMQLLEYQFALKSIENFIFKLNYYIEHNKIKVENIYLDFYSEFSLGAEQTLTMFYGDLKWAHDYLKFEKPYNGRSIVDIFFLKMVNYLNYKILLKYINS